MPSQKLRKKDGTLTKYGRSKVASRNAKKRPRHTRGPKKGQFK